MKSLFSYKPITRSPLLVLAVVLAFARSAWGGGTITNCTQADLQAALIGGGAVSFACAGTITLTQTVVIAHDTVLDANGFAVTISGGNTVRLFQVNPNVAFSVLGMTLAEGFYVGAAGANTSPPQPGYDGFGAGILNLGGTVALTGCALTNHCVQGGAAGSDPARSGSWGYYAPGGNAFGAALCNLGGTLNLTNCVLAGNSAWGGTSSYPKNVYSLLLVANEPIGGLGLGGAIYTADGQVQCQGVTVYWSTLAGGGGVGSADGTNSAALFSMPEGVAVDGARNVYVADSMSDTVRKITADGVVTTIGGLAYTPEMRDGWGSDARFITDTQLAVDASGNVYVTDPVNARIVKGVPPLSSFAVALVAGTYWMNTLPNQPGFLAPASLLQTCTAPTGDAVTVTSVSPAGPQGGTVQLSGSTITYTPSPGFLGLDSFTYTVLDSRGASTQGTVMVAVSPIPGGLYRLGIDLLPNHSVAIQFVGLPGTPYNVEASVDLVNWTPIGTMGPGTNGWFEFDDTPVQFSPNPLLPVPCTIESFSRKPRYQQVASGLTQGGSSECCRCWGRARGMSSVASLWDGQTVMLGGPISGGGQVMVLVTPTLFDSAGNWYHTKDEMPFAESSFPPEDQTAAVPIQPSSVSETPVNRSSHQRFKTDSPSRQGDSSCRMAIALMGMVNPPNAALSRSYRGD